MKRVFQYRDPNDGSFHWNFLLIFDIIKLILFLIMMGVAIYFVING